MKIDNRFTKATCDELNVMAHRFSTCKVSYVEMSSIAYLAPERDKRK